MHGLRFLSVSLRLSVAVLVAFSSPGAHPPVSTPGQLKSIPDTLLSAGEFDYPPFSVVGADSTVDGFAVELLRASLNAMGKEVRFGTGPWYQIKDDLAAGRLDVLPLVGRTPEREEVFDFTFPYTSMHGAVFVRRNSEVRQLEDLAGKSVAVLRADNAEEFMRRVGITDRLVTTATYHDAFVGLADGLYDGVVAQKLLGLAMVRSLGLESLRTAGKPLDGFRQDFCFAVRKGNHDLLAVLNEGLSLALGDGTKERLARKWFGSDNGSVPTVVVVGGDYTYPPFEYLDDKGGPAGFLVDLTRAIARRTGTDVAITLDTWNKVRHSLEAGDIDVVQGMFYSPERAEQFVFSPPHTFVDHVVCSRGDTPYDGTVEGLRNKRILVMDGDIMHDFALEHGLSDSLVPVPTQQEALQKLSAGLGDYALVARLPALHWVKRLGLRNVTVDRAPLVSSQYCYAVKHGREEVLSRFTEGLAAVKASGELRRIQEKHFGVLDSLPPDRLLLLWYLAFALLVLVVVSGGLLAWTRILSAVVKRRTGELAERESMFRQLAENIPEVLWLGSRDWCKLHYINPAYETVWGRPCAEMAANPLAWLDGIVPQDLPAVRTAVENGPSVGMSELTFPPFRISRPDGTLRWIWAAVYPIEGEDGSDKMVGIAQDVTASRHAIEALQQERARAERYLDIVASMIVAIDREGKILLLNPSARRILECEQSDPTGADWFDTFVPSDEREELRELFRRFMDGEADAFEQVESTVVTRTGAIRVVRWHNRAVYDEHGGIGGLLSSGEDITDLAAVQERIAELARFPSEDPNPVLRLSRSGTVVYRNPATLKFLSDAGLTEIDLPLILPTGLPTLLAAALERGRTYANLEVRVGHRFLSYTLVPIPSLGYANLYAMDITDRRRAEVDLVREREYLDTVRKVSDALNSGCSYDSVAEIIREGLDLHGVDIGLMEDNFLRVVGAASVLGGILTKGIRKLVFDFRDNSRALDYYNGLTDTTSISLEELTDLTASAVAVPLSLLQEVIGILRKTVFGEMLLVPLFCPSGNRLGVVLFTKRRGGVFAADEGVLLKMFCGSLALFVERGRMQAVLVRNRNRLARAQEIARMGSWEWEVASDGIEWSAGLRRLYGLSDNEPVHASLWLERAHPEDRPALERLVHRAVTLHASFSADFRAVLADGRMGHMHVETEVVCSHHRKPPRIIGTIQDVSEQWKAEQALKRNEARQRALLDGLPDMMFRISRGGVILDFRAPNPDDLALDPDRVVGTDLRSVFSPDVSAMFAAKIAEALRGGTTVTCSYSATTRAGVGTFEARLTTCGDGEVVGLVRNISKQVELEEHLRQSQKMQAVGQLAGGIAHDFNNQLGGILGNADLIRERVREDPQLERWTRNIIAGVSRAADLTTKLLAFARKTPQRVEQISIALILEETVELLKHTVDRRIRIRVEQSDTTLQVEGDPTMLQNALLNLGLNARDAMPDGGTLTFKAAAEQIHEHAELAPGSYVRLIVRDTGQGISQNDLARVFDPFFTTKRPGKGTGMGLAAVYGTVKSHSGAILVDSRVGGGTTFQILLPRSRRSTGEGGDDDSKETKLPGMLSVLVVDDEPVLLETAGDMLELSGFRVLRADCGHEALRLYRDNASSIDLVILDMVMPDLNGVQVFEAMRAINERVRVIVASGYSREGDVQKVLEAGALDFVQKPFRRSDLMKVIHQIMDRG